MSLNQHKLPETGAESLHERLLSDVRAFIVRGGVAEGARIPEAALCERFGVSRTPLREVLKSLSMEGLVTLRPNRGSVVTPLNKDDVMQAFEAKGVLESFIGEHATRRATDQDLAKVAGIHDDLVDAARDRDFEKYTRLNSVFHHTLAELAGNREVTTFYARLQAKLQLVRYRINHDPLRLQVSLSEHQGVLDALFVRARLDAAARLVEHNSATAQVVLNQFSAAR